MTLDQETMLHIKYMNITKRFPLIGGFYNVSIRLLLNNEESKHPSCNDTTPIPSSKALLSKKRVLLMLGRA